MNREEYLEDAFSAYLDRRALPQSLKGKGAATKDELQALCRAVLRFAPLQGWRDWFGDFCDRLDEEMTHRAWPTVGEIAKAARGMRGPSRATIAEPGEVDNLGIIAARVRNGEHVGEGWIYGRGAVDLIAGGHVSEKALAPYRSAAFFARRDLHGETSALAWEREQKALHDHAMRLWRNPAPKVDPRRVRATMASVSGVIE